MINLQYKKYGFYIVGFNDFYNKYQNKYYKKWNLCQWRAFSI